MSSSGDLSTLPPPACLGMHDMEAQLLQFANSRSSIRSERPSLPCFSDFAADLPNQSGYPNFCQSRSVPSPRPTLNCIDADSACLPTFGNVDPSLPTVPTMPTIP